MHKRSLLNQALHRSSPTLKRAGKFILITAVAAAPGGIAGWAVRSVSRRPLRLLLAMTLEPLLSRIFSGVSKRLIREKDETTARRTDFTD
ncbi:phage shock protein D [Erwinia sp. OLTSP20]|uniref:phage shock protein PspD n=1 Tax=unclassified Erwinia TaxID=2622719 RepID=UPI000C18C520|nr:MULTISPECIES: phage shock protein PspD [unclassified Erwinia]PIJ51773.1 phage shock protein D [Erwinia sp. OAMSP11]PIJ74362.1 phage shock protein D [Erwinia sp. OLSSP12]PIJ83805.1 phage shock protein D [Erwinia sp. OLCASP19]PIJ86848.1 phage shock protein D [Erwinia sp. OLMTSP26]PIJ88255.1 phage shock protein D [Erwinia sp. OLMDSP33]